MKSKKKYNRNKKVNPYTLEQFRLGGFNGFGIDPSTNNVPMPSNVPVGGSIPEIPVDPIAGGGMPGTIPWDTLANVGVQGVEAFSKNDNMYGQEIDSQGESVGKGALKGAGKGASLGTMIMPGIGTAIGAGVGAIAGGIGESMKNKKQREAIQAPLADMSGNVSQNPYGTPSFKDGGIPSYPDGGSPELQKYEEFKKHVESARQAVGTQDKETLKKLGTPDKPYTQNNLSGDFSRLQQMRQAAGLGVGEEASILFPHVGQSLRGGFNEMFGTQFKDGGLTPGPTNKNQPPIDLKLNQYESPSNYKYGFLNSSNGNIMSGTGLGNETMGAGLFGMTPSTSKGREYFKGVVDGNVNYNVNDRLNVKLGASDAIGGGFNPSLNAGIKYKFKDGGMPNNPMINIEKGELNVDLESGDILDDYDTHQFKPHSKGKNKEHLGNFVEASQNGVVIPKKWRDEYMKNKDARKGIIRNVLNNQIDRELYGKDADGNTKSFAKMKAGGVQQYIFGGVNGDPLRSPMDLRENNPEFDNIFSSYNQGQDPMYQNRNTANENPLFNFQNVNYPQKNQYPTTSYNPADPLPENLPQFNTDKNFLGIMNNNDPASAPNFQSGPTSSRSNPQFVDSNAERLFNRQDRKDDNLWTTGNTIGAAGNVLGAVGPLAATLANGIDRNETNEFANVEGAAIHELSGIHRRGKENTFNNIKRQSNIASNMNRNRTSSFASLLSNEQQILDSTQQNLGEAGLGYDTNEANTISQLRFQGDMRDAAGRQDMFNRLDQNRDNFFSNLSSNFSNMGDMTQNFGKNANKNEENKAKLKILQQISPDFSMNAKGELTFKGKKYE